MELHKVKKEVVYKVGRNVLLFQQMEGVLKYLVSHGNIAGTATELKPKFDKQKQSVSKRTLGMVVGDFLDGTTQPPEPEKLTEVYFSFSFETEVDEDLKAEIEELVAERNNLIHHFFAEVEVESLDSWLNASDRLDAQEVKLGRVIENLRKIAQTLSDGRKALADFMTTEEFKQRALHH
ncbi:MAG: hypothetical protein H6986_03655 [Pseudomonadales bacterium]|nr:hypothetical protein [Pseudomonadales bacterium]